MDIALTLVMIFGYVLASAISIHSSNKMLQIERSSQKTTNLLLEAATLLKKDQSIEAASIVRRINQEWGRGY